MDTAVSRCLNMIAAVSPRGGTMDSLTTNEIAGFASVTLLLVLLLVLLLR